MCNFQGSPLSTHFNAEYAKNRVSTLIPINSTLLSTICQIKITKKCVFMRNKRINTHKNA